MDPVLLTEAQAFLWGALGGLGALLITQVLPFATTAVRTGAGPALTPWRIIGALLIALIFIAAGGLAAVVMGDTASKGQALLYGVAWEALLGGVIKAGAAASV